jgi:hypothetical protein
MPVTDVTIKRFARQDHGSRTQAAGAKVVGPSLKATIPVGVGPLSAVTFAVNVIALPAVDTLSLEVAPTSSETHDDLLTLIPSDGGVHHTLADRLYTLDKTTRSNLDKLVGRDVLLSAHMFVHCECLRYQDFLAPALATYIV